MTNAKQLSRQFLEISQETVAQLRQTDAPTQLGVALANLGAAFFQTRQYQEGMEQFDQALALAQELGDIQLQKQVLGTKAVAYQEIKRFPDAYETATQILVLAEEAQDEGMKCDALISQGQTMLESGEPMIAAERVREAKEIALALGDKRRQMAVQGVMGHISLAIAAINQAETHFDYAFALAKGINDDQAAYGFLGNKGMLLSWSGDHHQAISAFAQVYAYFVSVAEVQGQLQSLNYLVKGYTDLHDTENALRYAERGIAVGQAEEPEFLLPFYHAVIPIYYGQGQTEQAQQAATHAARLIRKVRDRNQRLDYLLKQLALYQEIGLFEQVMETGTAALQLAGELNRQSDTVHLIGVLGSTLAAQGEFQQMFDLFVAYLDGLNSDEDLPTERALLHQLIRACDRLNQMDPLLAYTVRAQALAQEAKDDQTDQRYARLLMDALLRNGRYEAAIPLLNVALAQMNGHDASPRQLDLLMALGDAHFSLDQYEAALATFEQALPLSNQVNQPIFEAQLLGRMGSVYAEQGQLDRSITYTSGALEVARRLGDAQTVGELLCLLALNYRDLDQIPQAIESCKKAIAAFAESAIQETGTQSSLYNAQSLLNELTELAE